jgi:hypothetical protein
LLIQQVAVFHTAWNTPEHGGTRIGRKPDLKEGIQAGIVERGGLSEHPSPDASSLTIGFPPGVLKFFFKSRDMGEKRFVSVVITTVSLSRMGAGHLRDTGR